MARLFERLAAHQTGDLATIIAFNIIYAMFPLALSLWAIGGYVFHGEAARAHLLREVQAAFPGQVAKEMGDVINTAGGHPGLIGIIGFASLLWAGSNLFATIEVSFSRIYGVPPRGIVHQRIMAFLMILAFSILLMLSIAASNAAVLLAQWRGGPLLGTLGGGGREAAGLAGGWIFATLMYLVLYRVVPNVRLTFAALWPGAVLAGTSFQLITLAFPLYIRYLAGFNRFGDAFSLVFLLMTWSYLLGLILLVGAEVNALCAAPGPGQAPRAGYQPPPVP